MIAVVLALLLAQSSGRGVSVSGVVQDQTGAVLPSAQVAITASNAAAPLQSTPTDASGAFRFDRVMPGTYTLRVEFPGFKASSTSLRVGTRPPSSLTIVMQIESVVQEVSVSGGAAETSTAATANLDAITVNGDALDDLTDAIGITEVDPQQCAQAAARYVRVAIDESRGRRPSLKIQNVRMRTRER